MFGNGSALPAPSCAALRVVARPLNVPNRLSATIIDHRSAAQYGTVLRAHVEHLGLAAAGQRRAADAGRRRGHRAAAHLVERRGGHRGDRPDERGEARAGRARRPARAACGPAVAALQQHESEHDGHDRDDRPAGEQQPVPPLRPLLRPPAAPRSASAGRRPGLALLAFPIADPRGITIGHCSGSDCSRCWPASTSTVGVRGEPWRPTGRGTGTRGVCPRLSGWRQMPPVTGPQRRPGVGGVLVRPRVRLFSDSRAGYR